MRKHALLLFLAILLTVIINGAICQKSSTIDSLVLLLNSENTHDGKLKLLYNLANILVRTDPKKGAEYANEGISLLKNVKDFKKLAEFKFTLGLNLYAQGNPSESLINFQDALLLYEKLQLKDGIARSQEKLGEYYNYSGDLTKAFYYFNKALAYYNTSGEKDVLNKAKVLQHLGVVSRFQNKHSQAIQYY
jgi:tetratricopeptide (TPR) repeat protein